MEDAICFQGQSRLSNKVTCVERLSPLLDWKNLGVEYSKSRQLALRRAYPGAFYGEGDESGDEYASSDYFSSEIGRMPPLSVPASPRSRGQAIPGDIGTLTEEMQSLTTSDYRGANQGYNQTGAGGTYANQGGAGGINWPSQGDEDDGYPFPLVRKVRSRSGSVMTQSGMSTPGGGAFRSLSETDLKRADAALSQDEGDGGQPNTRISERRWKRNLDTIHVSFEIVSLKFTLNPSRFPAVDFARKELVVVDWGQVVYWPLTAD
ncbi:hypothetical protein C8J56DRAFT_900521 [Mycena floridula]|nr:hypothetical protein C8J56DRAFT_900521 [Mycena floridula]